MRNKALTAICTASASLSIAAALASSAYIAIMLALLSLAAFYMLHKRSGGDDNRRDNDVLQFVSNLIDNYSNSINTARLLGISLSKDFWFYKEMKDSVSKYSIDGSAEASFSKLLGSDSMALRHIASIIAQRLDSGAEILDPLKEIRRRIILDSRYKLRSLGSVLNSNSVVGLGSMLFFPAFAGISLQIIRFTNISQGISAANPLPLIAIFAFYMVYINTLNFRYSSNDELRIEKSALSSSIAMLVFKICSGLPIGML